MAECARGFMLMSQPLCGRCAPASTDDLPTEDRSRRSQLTPQGKLASSPLFLLVQVNRYFVWVEGWGGVITTDGTVEGRYKEIRCNGCSSLTKYNQCIQLFLDISHLYYYVMNIYFFYIHIFLFTSQFICLIFLRAML